MSVKKPRFLLVFNKGHSIRDSTENFSENKGHVIYSVLNSGEIRDSLVLMSTFLSFKMKARITSK